MIYLNWNILFYSTGTTCEVGFGRAKAPDGKWYAVANYYPAGNYISQFRENVSPPIDVDRV